MIRFGIALKIGKFLLTHRGAFYNGHVTNSRGRIVRRAWLRVVTKREGDPFLPWHIL